jgi:hypothetical protein
MTSVATRVWLTYVTTYDAGATPLPTRQPRTNTREGCMGAATGDGWIGPTGVAAD